MIRLLWYLLVGYILWKLVQAVMKVLTGPANSGQQSSPPPPPGPSRSEFKDIKDAEFEDISPTKGPKKPGSSSP